MEPPAARRITSPPGCAGTHSGISYTLSADVTHGAAELPSCFPDVGEPVSWKRRVAAVAGPLQDSSDGWCLRAAGRQCPLSRRRRGSSTRRQGGPRGRQRWPRASRATADPAASGGGGDDDDGRGCRLPSICRAAARPCSEQTAAYRRGRQRRSGPPTEAQEQAAGGLWTPWPLSFISPSLSLSGVRLLLLCSPSLRCRRRIISERLATPPRAAFGPYDSENRRAAALLGHDQESQLVSRRRHRGRDRPLALTTMMGARLFLRAAAKCRRKVPPPIRRKANNISFEGAPADTCAPVL